VYAEPKNTRVATIAHNKDAPQMIDGLGRGCRTQADELGERPAFGIFGPEKMHHQTQLEWNQDATKAEHERADEGVAGSSSIKTGSRRLVG